MVSTVKLTSGNFEERLVPVAGNSHSMEGPGAKHWPITTPVTIDVFRQANALGKRGLYLHFNSSGPRVSQID